MSNCSSCNSAGSFAQLQDYYRGERGTVNFQRPQGTGPLSQATQLVPVFGTFGYEALTHGGREGVTAGCGGQYFTIDSAYPAYPGNCQGYAYRACDGNQIHK